MFQSLKIQLWLCKRYLGEQEQNVCTWLSNSLKNMYAYIYIYAHIYVYTERYIHMFGYLQIVKNKGNEEKCKQLAI